MIFIWTTVLIILFCSFSALFWKLTTDVIWTTVLFTLFCYIFLYLHYLSLVFKNKKIEPFSMNLIWDLLIKNKELLGIKSKQEFLHVTNLEIYNKLIEKRF